MRVGLDCQLAGKPTGIGRYTSSLIKNLVPLLGTQHEIVLLVTSSNQCTSEAANVSIKSFWPLQRALRANTYVPWVMRHEAIEVYHAVDNLSLPLVWPKRSTRYVLTVHDIIPVLCPSAVPMKHHLYFRLAIRRLLRLADAVITVSQHCKKDLVERFNISPNKIRVIYNGVDRSFSPSSQNSCDSVLKGYGIRKAQYFLFVGNIEPRKNLPTLIRAFSRLLKEKRLPSGQKLVIVGQKGQLCKDVLRLPWQLGIDKEVLFLGNVPEVHLPDLYRAASAFVFPSVYEGFGLPVLEAMACGTPVISSNYSSLPEIVGDAALLVDARSDEEMAEAMYKVLDDEAVREEVRYRGLKRAAMFSWKKTARQTLAVYEEIYGGGYRLP